MFRKYSFTVTERERDWLLIALDEEIFKRTMLATDYSLSRSLNQGTKKLQKLYEKLKIMKKGASDKTK
jgi:hypothetical protein